MSPTPAHRGPSRAPGISLASLALLGALAVFASTIAPPARALVTNEGRKEFVFETVPHGKTGGHNDKRHTPPPGSNGSGGGHHLEIVGGGPKDKGRTWH